MAIIGIKNPGQTKNTTHYIRVAKVFRVAKKATQHTARHKENPRIFLLPVLEKKTQKWDALPNISLLENFCILNFFKKSGQTMLGINCVV